MDSSKFWQSPVKAHSNSYRTHFCDDVFSVAFVAYEVLHGGNAASSSSSSSSIDGVSQFIVDYVREHPMDPIFLPPHCSPQALCWFEWRSMVVMKVFFAVCKWEDYAEKTNLIVPSKCNGFLASFIDSVWKYYKSKYSFNDQCERFPFNEHLIFLPPLRLASIFVWLCNFTNSSSSASACDQLVAKFTESLSSPKYNHSYFRGLTKENGDNRAEEKNALLKLIDNYAIRLDVEVPCSLMNAIKRVRDVCVSYKSTSNSLSESILQFMEFCPDIFAKLQEALDECGCSFEFEDDRILFK